MLPIEMTHDRPATGACSSITVELAAVADKVRHVGLALLALGVATSSLTFNWIVEYDRRVNFFPEFGGRVIYLSDILLVAGLAVWVAGRQLFPHRRLSLGPPYVAYPLLLLVVLSALSIVWASDPGLAGYATTRRLLLFAVYVVLVNDGKRGLATIVAALFAIALLHLVVAWAQVRQGSLLGLSFLGEIEVGTDTGCPRPTGLGFNPNPLGLFFAVVCAAAFALFLFAEGHIWKTARPFMLFSMTLLGLLMTMCRSAFLGWTLGGGAVTILAWLWDRGHRQRTVTRFVLAAVLTVGASWLLPAIAPVAPHCGERPNRYSRVDFSTSAFDRFADFGLSATIIRENVWLGVGAANYPLQLAKRLRPLPESPAVPPVHNVPLLLWAELGLMGLASWLLLMCGPLIWAFARWRSARVDLNELVWLPPLLVLFGVAMLDFTPWATQDGRVLMMAVLGLWAGAIADGAGSSSNSSSSLQIRATSS